MLNIQSVLCLCAVFGLINGSAIPMWEYLSKQEKMSYIYSLFANQVESYCESLHLDKCNHQLLKYGLNQLKTLTEEELDAMDPYQRGANNIIWETMMKDHMLMKTTPNPRSTTTAKPNSYDDESFDDELDSQDDGTSKNIYIVEPPFGDEFGSEEAASAKIDNVYVVRPPKDFVLKVESGKPQYTYPHNVVSYLKTFSKPEAERESVLTRFQNQYHPVAVTTEKIVRESPKSVPLTGPLVVKVYPDGSPVEGTTHIPQDEDLMNHRLTKVKIPSL